MSRKQKSRRTARRTERAENRAELEARVEELEQRVVTLTAHLSWESNRYNTSQANLVQKQMTVNALLEELRLPPMSEGSRAEIAALKEQLDKVTGKSDVFFAALKAAKKTIETLEHRLLLSRRNRDRLQDKVARLEREIQQARRPASIGQLPKALWRQLARLVHPDVHVDARKELATKAMQQLQAYKPE
jgi:chromosome segregation ATPase